MDCRKIRSARGGADHLERSLLFEVSRREGSASYSAALVLGVGAMLAKENAYLLPVLLLLVELFLVRPARLKPVLPFGLLTMAVLIYRLAALGSIGGYVGDTGAPAVFDIGLQTIEGVLLRAPALSLLGLNWLQPGPVVPIAAFLAGLLLAMPSVPDSSVTHAAS